MRLAIVVAAVLAAASPVVADVTILVHPDRLLNPVTPYQTGVCLEDVNHEVYGGLYSQMIFGESFQESPSKEAAGVSGQWRPTGGGSYAVVTDDPFVGHQCQRMTADESGSPEIENRGLNRQGLHWAKGRPYDGVVWLRSRLPATLIVSAQTGDGDHEAAEQRIITAGDGWQRYPFTLTPSADVDGGRFAIASRRPGTVDVGYASIEPGEWGRFHGLPVRRDVVELLQQSGVTVVRYGGSAVNEPEYRWKHMIGPRDRRPPYRGHWYPQASNGWGIIDFLDLCDAAGWLAVPAFCADETPADMADFVEYANGPAKSTWGGKRAADGHAEPYKLKYLEFGNEEQVNAAYAAKFKPAAEAIWARDPAVTIVVGDFEYRSPITDPMHVHGAHVTDLSAHKQILDWSKAHGRAVAFDVHIWNDRPTDPGKFIEALPTLADAMTKLSPGADFKLCVFEENANSHGMRRALAHARTVSLLQRLGDRVPIVCCANALQVDGQNDNGWDQGLCFLNPSHAWSQPPLLVTQMIARGYRPSRVAVDTDGDPSLTVTALAGGDPGGVTVEVTNPSAIPVAATVDAGVVIRRATSTELAADPAAVNTAADPRRVAPVESALAVVAGRSVRHTFPAHSFTVVRLTP